VSPVSVKTKSIGPSIGITLTRLSDLIYFVSVQDCNIRTKAAYHVLIKSSFIYILCYVAASVIKLRTGLRTMPVCGFDTRRPVSHPSLRSGIYLWANGREIRQMSVRYI
jgi:hypothetical protein